MNRAPNNRRPGMAAPFAESRRSPRQEQPRHAHAILGGCRAETYRGTERIASARGRQWPWVVGEDWPSESLSGSVGIVPCEPARRAPGLARRIRPGGDVAHQPEIVPVGALSVRPNVSNLEGGRAGYATSCREQFGPAEVRTKELGQVRCRSARRHVKKWWDRRNMKPRH